MTAKTKKLLEKAKKITGLKDDDTIISKALNLFVEKYSIGENKGVTAYDLTKHIAGSLEGPEDLSTNKKYFEGFGFE